MFLKRDGSSKYSQFSSYNGIIMWNGFELIDRLFFFSFRIIFFLIEYTGNRVNATRITLFPDSKWRFSQGVRVDGGGN